MAAQRAELERKILTGGLDSVGAAETEKTQPGSQERNPKIEQTEK